MSYFNYHAKCKNLIKQGQLVNYEIMQNHNGIKPALVLTFESGLKMPIRQHKWDEYFELIEQIK